MRLRSHRMVGQERFCEIQLQISHWINHTVTVQTAGHQMLSPPETSPKSMNPILECNYRIFEAEDGILGSIIRLTASTVVRF